MQPRELFDLAVQLQSVTPRNQSNARALALIDALRRSLSVIEEPFHYALEFQNLAPAATATQFIQIQADADFILQTTQYEVDVNGAAVTISTFTYPNVNVLLTDTGNGRQLMDRAIPIVSVFGNGQLPYVWPTPKLLSARSTLQVQLTSFEAANTLDIRLIFSGKKLYPLPG